MTMTWPEIIVARAHLKRDEHRVYQLGKLRNPPGAKIRSRRGESKGDDGDDRSALVASSPTYYFGED